MSVGQPEPQVDRAVAEIAKAAADSLRLERVWLFGSRARAQASPELRQRILTEGRLVYGG